MRGRGVNRRVWIVTIAAALALGAAARFVWDRPPRDDVSAEWLALAKLCREAIERGAPPDTRGLDRYALPATIRSIQGLTSPHGWRSWKTPNGRFAILERESGALPKVRRLCKVVPAGARDLLAPMEQAALIRSFLIMARDLAAAGGYGEVETMFLSPMFVIIVRGARKNGRGCQPLLMLSVQPETWHVEMMAGERSEASCGGGSLLDGDASAI